jgi:ammonia channel protein AmtB
MDRVRDWRRRRVGLAIGLPAATLACGACAVAQTAAAPAGDRIAALERTAAQNATAIAKAQSAGDNDDSLDAFGVHGAGGTVGAILTGLFANSVIHPVFGVCKATEFFEGNHLQVVHQLLGVAIAWGLSIAGTLLILFVVDKLMGLRVSEDAEREGLDLSQHGEEGYDWETA